MSKETKSINTLSSPDSSDTPSVDDGVTKTTDELKNQLPQTINIINSDIASIGEETSIRGITSKEENHVIDCDRGKNDITEINPPTNSSSSVPIITKADVNIGVEKPLEGSKKSLAHAKSIPETAIAASAEKIDSLNPDTTSPDQIRGKIM